MTPKGISWLVLSLLSVHTWYFAFSLPIVDPGLFVILGVKTCGSGMGYCMLGTDCTLDHDFLPDINEGHCDGLRSAFTPSASFVCCRVNPESANVTVHEHHQDKIKDKIRDKLNQTLAENEPFVQSEEEEEGEEMEEEGIQAKIGAQVIETNKTGTIINSTSMLSNSSDISLFNDQSIENKNFSKNDIKQKVNTNELIKKQKLENNDKPEFNTRLNHNSSKKKNKNKSDVTTMIPEKELKYSEGILIDLGSSGDNPFNKIDSDLDDDDDDDDEEDGDDEKTSNEEDESEKEDGSTNTQEENGEEYEEHSENEEEEEDEGNEHDEDNDEEEQENENHEEEEEGETSHNSESISQSNPSNEEEEEEEEDDQKPFNVPITNMIQSGPSNIQSTSEKPNTKVSTTMSPKTKTTTSKPATTPTPSTQEILIEVNEIEHETEYPHVPEYIEQNTIPNTSELTTLETLKEETESATTEGTTLITELMQDLTTTNQELTTIMTTIISENINKNNSDSEDDNLIIPMIPIQEVSAEFMNEEITTTSIIPTTEINMNELKTTEATMETTTSLPQEIMKEECDENITRHASCWFVQFINGSERICAGSFLRPDIIVTSASCSIRLFQVGIENLQVVVGDHISSDVQVRSVLIHEEYRPPDETFLTPSNDIGLLRLEPTQTESCSLCLPHEDQQFTGENCFAGNVEARDAQQASDNCLPCRPENLPENATEEMKAICENECRSYRELISSGVPLVCGAYLAGIGTSAANDLRLYAPISRHVPWIKECIHSGF